MCAKNTERLEDLSVVGIDIGKDTFHLIGFDWRGQVVLRSLEFRVAVETCGALKGEERTFAARARS